MLSGRIELKRTRPAVVSVIAPGLPTAPFSSISQRFSGSLTLITAWVSTLPESVPSQLAKLRKPYLRHGVQPSTW